MKNVEIEKSLRDCESLLKEKEINPRTQELLTKAILIEICASFNEEIESLLKKKLSTISDKSLRNFANSYIESELRRRNFNYERVKGLVGKFGNSYKDKLDKEIENRGNCNIIIASYNSLFSNRNHAAHSQNIQVTLNQVQDYYEKAHLVLDGLQRTLEVC